MKKLFKITGISLLIIIALLAAAPFIFQSQIKDMVRNFINNNVNANVEFTDVDLNFFSSFPKASVSVSELKIKNFEPFKDETLATVKALSFEMSVNELFKNADEEPVVINTIIVDEAFINLKTNTQGETNYDIAKKDDNSISSEDENNSSGFVLSIENYAINNSAFNYLDESSNTVFSITELNHNGSGTFSDNHSELQTNTNANVSFSKDSTAYLNKNAVKLDALIGLDLKESKYTFKDNKAQINNLDIEFKGYVQQQKDAIAIDMSFENLGDSFKDFLAVIPETYSKDLNGVETTGDFKISGIAKGLITEETIPTLDIKLTSSNASFKYPDLPKRVENIDINVSVKNNTGKLDDTYVDINTLNFKIDKDVFKSSATIKNIANNALVNAHIDGILNLGNITKAYPIALENELSGILNAKLDTAFDMNAIETNAFERIKNKGDVNVTDFIFSSEDIVNPINISQADINFNTQTISLTNFKAKTGKTDFNATGNMNNLLGFLLSDKKLQGTFNVDSDLFLVSDFMVEGGSDQPINQSTEPADALKIPAFLDCKINADAKTVVYDNLTLKDVKGTLLIKDEQANLQNVTSSIFDGNLSISGLIDTKTTTPKFNMDLGVTNFDISQSFNSLDLLQNLAPIAKALQGKLNGTISLSGLLGEDFNPVLNSITGDALAELLTTKVEPKNAEVFNQLKGALSFVDFDKLDLKDIKTRLKFKDGKVNVSPFNLNYKDIAITVDGTHGFDKTLSYNAVFNIPAKYLGNDINNLIAKIDDNSANNITIPVTANILGTFTDPKVTTDLSSGVSKLTNQLIEIQKQKLLNTGKDKAKDLLNDIMGGNDTDSDSTSSENNNPINNVLNDIIGGNSIKNDSTKSDSSATPNTPVKDILDLFGKKKKKKKTSND